MNKSLAKIAADPRVSRADDEKKMGGDGYWVTLKKGFADFGHDPMQPTHCIHEDTITGIKLRMRDVSTCNCSTCNEDVASCGPLLKRYAGRVKFNDGKLSGEYVDWFANDNDALATYRVIMEQQGYKVKAVTVENQTAIVEIA